MCDLTTQLKTILNLFWTNIYWLRGVLVGCGGGEEGGGVGGGAFAGAGWWVYWRRVIEGMVASIHFRLSKKELFGNNILAGGSHLPLGSSPSFFAHILLLVFAHKVLKRTSWWVV